MQTSKLVATVFLAALALPPAADAGGSEDSPYRNAWDLVDQIHACVEDPDPVECLLEFVEEHGCVNSDPLRVCRVCYAFHVEQVALKESIVHYTISHAPETNSLDDIVGGHVSATLYGYGSSDYGGGYGRHVFEFDVNGVPSCE